MKKLDNRFYRLLEALDYILFCAEEFSECPWRTYPGDEGYFSLPDWQELYASLRIYWTRCVIVSTPNNPGSYGDKTWTDSQGRLCLRESPMNPRLYRGMSNRSLHKVKLRKYDKLSRPQRRLVKKIQEINARIWDLYTLFQKAPEVGETVTVRGRVGDPDRLGVVVGDSERWNTGKKVRFEDGHIEDCPDVRKHYKGKEIVFR